MLPQNSIHVCVCVCVFLVILWKLPYDLVTYLCKLLKSVCILSTEKNSFENLDKFYEVAYLLWYRYWAALWKKIQGFLCCCHEHQITRNKRPTSGQLISVEFQNSPTLKRLPVQTLLRDLADSVSKLFFNASITTAQNFRHVQRIVLSTNSRSWGRLLASISNIWPSAILQW